MVKSLATLLLGAACALSSCQQSPNANTEPQAAVETTQQKPAESQPRLATEADAYIAVRKYIQAQPNAALFMLDSTSVNDNGATWQVLVPRTDWAKRMPNSARFEVSKATGEVSTGAVK